MRAIDLYAGIGGWSLGLKLAGIEVVASYEWWQPAIDTHNGNHNGDLKPVDIRQLRLSDLPTDIDVVVGSPPCTEFSYANRGGSGDIAEGIKDLVKFFEVVDHLKPRFWAMENVPRVAEVLRHGFASDGHALYRFRHLEPVIEIVDFSEYGAPQARRRCIAGNIPFDLVRGYQPHIPSRTLGDVVRAVSVEDVVVDPVWGTRLPPTEVSEIQTEPPLNSEELRMNREAKEFHPVFNNMAFPDPLDEPSRTVTATCTRVSRESIVIADPRNPALFRRLTVRERASLQGFPITYQFYAKSFSEKAKMVGNAIPPTFTYLLALAARGVTSEEFRESWKLEDVGGKLALPQTKAPVTLPDGEGRTYPEGRSFRAAIPQLRFKSGMRFDLSNDVIDGDAYWKVRFFFGSSKDIREVPLDGTITQTIKSRPIVSQAIASTRSVFQKAENDLWSTNPDQLQSVWTHRDEGLHPYNLVDRLAMLADAIHAQLEAGVGDWGSELLSSLVLAIADDGEGPLPSRSKLEKYAPRIVSGFLVGDWFNTLAWHTEHEAAA